MALDTINNLKSLAATYQALLLADITATDGSVLRVSTADLSSYGGHAYLGRVIRHDLSALQSMSEAGLDIMPNVAFTLADADKILFDWDRAHGIAGARIVLVFTYYDWDSQFSSDSYKAWTGRCKAPSNDDTTLSFSATSIVGLSTRLLPSTPIQRTCPWIHPDTTAAKAEANNKDSRYYRCGDTDAGHTSCAYTKEACIANGMWALGRYGGIQWTPPLGTRIEREYVSGSRIQVRSTANSARYGDYVPLVYGTAWVDGITLTAIPDGNSTRGEVLLVDGEISDLIQVVCDDEILPPATSFPDRNALQVYDPLFRYNVWGNGTRDGAVNTDAGFDGQGDPYGSMVAIEYCIPRKADNPRVRALVKGKKIRVYTDSVTYTEIYSENPVWIIADILNRAGWAWADIDIASFVAEAAWCDATVEYTDQYGNTATRPRYAASLVIRQRRSAADIINGLRRGCGAVLVPGGASGKLEIYLKKTMADQQPSPPDGTNAVAFASMQSDGTVADGYPAFHFHEYDTISIKRASNPDPPNQILVPFINAERDYVQDAVRMFDVDAVNDAGQERDAAVAIDGPNTYSQARQVGAVALAELLKGNPRGDSKGTEQWELETTARAVKLRVGQLVLIENAKHSL